ncbi:MAG: tRNA (adenosine(37)-N6)-threonylcarbamoyltransferase complex ATPase subunit type 1 TsaE, partial [Cohaesibacter sp.]|nr:tRNA (adenosine(37)-N6)-threonylcarbamoyltransferase complex ATPase subunit type 1 TsaE [Cohaesibacter sp.]
MGTLTSISATCPHPLVQGDSLVAVDIYSEDDTVALAAKLSKIFHAGDVVTLWGNLGAGKSAFCRGVIRAVTSPDEEVPSPTFTLVQIYEPDETAPIWHFDLYRLEDPDEVWELGFEEAKDEAVSLIEWPSRMGRLLPKH